MSKKPKPTDENIPPSWGSNLINVKGKVCQRKTQCPKTGDPCNEDDELSEYEDCDLSGIDQFVSDYKNNAISNTPPTFKKLLFDPGFKAASSRIEEEQFYSGDEGSTDGYTSDEEDDENSAAFKRKKAIAEDGKLVHYLRQKNTKRETQEDIDRLRSDMKDLPARSKIPVTTPKPSTSPRRVRSSEKLYAEEAPLSYPVEIKRSPKFLPKKSTPSCLKDQELLKLYDSATEAAVDEGEFNVDFAED